jgi:predicted Zn finger-like uncharacterized protein
MKISCESCGAKYTVSDDKVQGKSVKVKCRKCSAVIVVSSTGQVTTTPGQDAGASASAPAVGSYTVAVAEGDQRTMTLAEIVEAYNAGTIDAETFVWAEGMDDWQALRDVDMVVDALHAAAGGAAEVQPAAEAGGGEDLGATMAMVDGVPMGGQAAAYGAPAPQAASSPYSPGIGASASASRPSPSAPSAFGGGSAGFGGSAGASRGLGGAGAPATAARASAPLTGNIGGGGKPTEDSAIFSLNMLTAKVGATEGAAAPNFTEEEDSGLIDLKALAAGLSPDAMLTSPLDVTGGMAGVFPLGAPPPPVVAAPRGDHEDEKKGVSKLLIGGLAAAVLVLGAALVFIVVKGTGTPPVAPAPTVQTVVVIATATAPAPEDSSSAEPSASASASSSASAKVAAGGKAPPGGKATGKPTGASTGGGTPPPPPPPAGGGPRPCGCDPNDLMCNMRCSQKKK